MTKVKVEVNPPNTHVLPAGSILLWRPEDAPLEHLGTINNLKPGSEMESMYAVWRGNVDCVALLSADLKDHQLPWDMYTTRCLTYRESRVDLRQWHRTIKIWSWWHAPENFRKLSTNGGDEDWVALIPRKMGTLPLFHQGTPFGRCDVSKFRLRDGRTLRIGSHA